MGPEDWIERLAHLRRYRRHGERAPHKPLVLLAALGRFQALGDSSLTWIDAEPALKQLLRDFGPPRQTTAAHPFVRLGNDDGVWQLTTADGSAPSDSPAALRRSGATGRLDPELESDLRRQPLLLPTLVRFLLEDNFEDSMHDELCRSVGLDVEGAELALARGRVAALRSPRDPEFRRNVLRAYERRCAMCGYDGSIAGEAVGLDAAHIRWWSHDGPDVVSNGLCLCSLHHKLLDRGVLGVTDNGTVDVSQDFVARSTAAERLVIELAGRDLLEPQRGQPAPDAEHVAWHRTQVFRGPPRAA